MIDKEVTYEELGIRVRVIEPEDPEDSVVHVMDADGAVLHKTTPAAAVVEAEQLVKLIGGAVV